MKKSLFLAVFLLFLTSFSWGQEFSNISKELRMPSFQTTLYRNLDDNSLFITICPDNKYDSPVIFCLGETDAEAVEICHTLLLRMEIMQNGERVRVMQNGKRYLFIKRAFLSFPCFQIKQNGGIQAGHAYLYREVLKKIIKHLQKY